jgi:hypothetical protein
VLRAGGRIGFTVWAGPQECPGVRLVEEALRAHADLDVGLPEGPPVYLYGSAGTCRRVLAAAGFAPASVTFRTLRVAWRLPSPRFLFDAEREAGVRTAALLARQSPERLEAIRAAIEEAVAAYADGDAFALPMTAHLVTAVVG